MAPALEMISVPLYIRPAQPADYPAITAIHNAQTVAAFRTTAERLRAGDEAAGRRDASFRRLVAEEDGDVVATGSFHAAWSGEVHPGRLWVILHVRADRRHQGLDVRLLRTALDELGGGVTEAWTCIREDLVPAAGFLESAGFAEHFRSWGAHLDPQSFDAARFAPLVQQLEATGIRLLGAAELAGDHDRDARLITLQRAVEEDAVAFEPIIPQLLEDVRSPDTIPGSVVVAVASDGAYVGLASLLGDATQTACSSGFVGVARPYRNRGIATALMARTIAIARELGCRDLNAGGGGVNTSMLRVSRKLGFTIEPAWITFASER